MTDIRSEYAQLREAVLAPAAKKLEVYLRECLNGAVRVDRVCARAKAVDRFVSKATKTLPSGGNQYEDPFVQIQDQIGARIVVFYIQDVEAIENRVSPYFRPIEVRDIAPSEDAGFGYIGKHFVYFTPKDIFPAESDSAKWPKVFELQIKTLYQHAWAEANHDIAYKPNVALTQDDKRKIAYTAAQSWGADEMFRDLAERLALKDESVPAAPGR